MRLRSAARSLFDSFTSLVHRSRLAKRGTRRFDGLHAPVEVVTDEWGVPHIWADSTDDLFFAQGWVTARDRLFQIDYNRHAARGRLSEVVGLRQLPWRSLTVHLKDTSTLDLDVMLRAFGIEKAARESLPLHSEAARGVLSAYAAGVNAYLAEHPTTIEHRLLGRQPPPWTELDSLVLLKAMGFELNYSWRAILLAAKMAERDVPADVARLVCPRYPDDGPVIVEQWRSAAKVLGGVQRAAREALGWGAPGAGSNCWAVAGSHTESGGAILANDTHLNLLGPLPWHEVHLHGGGLDLHGFALAGLPGIGIGRTPKFAWGITAGLVQDTDYFVERVDPDQPTRYQTPDGWAEMTSREEIFRIRGRGYERRLIHSTRHGPVLETAGKSTASGYRHAVQWIGHTPSRELDGLWEVWHADSPEAFGHALRHHGCPTFNITYAGADGRVAYFLAGKLAKRKLGAPLGPLPGWSGEYDWQGEAPYEDNPRELDPARGYIVTANNRIAPRDYPYELGGLFEPPDRFNRISEQIQKLGRGITPEQMAAMQLDVKAPWGVAVRDVLLRVAGGPGRLAPDRQSLEHVALATWIDWDGEASASSAGAAVAYAVSHLAGDELIKRLAGDEAAFGYLELGSFIAGSLLELERTAPRLAELGVDAGDVVRTGFRRAVAELARALGTDPSAWRWGDAHPLWIRHRFHADPVLRPLFSIGPEPAGGGPDTVNRGDMNAANDFAMKLGAAMRFVCDLRGPTGTVLPAGQSGSRLSPHYDDQLTLFLEGELKPAPASKEAIVAESRELLLPKGWLAEPTGDGAHGDGRH